MFFAIMHSETQGYKSACHMAISEVSLNNHYAVYPNITS